MFPKDRKKENFMVKIDYKKEYKDLYMPKKKPSIVDVPEMVFIMVDGRAIRTLRKVIKMHWKFFTAYLLLLK